MAKQTKIDALQKYRNQLLDTPSLDVLRFLKRDGWSGQLTGIDQLYATMYHDWYALAKDVEDIDNAIKTLDWQIVPFAEAGEEPDERAIYAAKIVEEALWKRTQHEAGTIGHSFTDLLGSLVHAIYRGYNVHEIEWHNDGRLVYPARYYPLPPQFYAWETEAGKQDRLLYVPDGNSAKGEPFPENRFIVALNQTGPDHPIYNAVFYPLVNLYIAYKHGLGWFLEYAQRFHLPKTVIHYDSEREKNKILRDLQEERVINTILLGRDNNVEFLASPQGGATLPQHDLLTFAESACHKLILGQTLTSDTSDNGGSLAQAKVHAGVLSSVVMKRAAFVEEIINNQLIPAVVKLNFGTTEMPMPEIRCKLPESAINSLVADYLQKVMALPGMKLKKTDVYEMLKLAMPGESDEVFEQTTPPAAGGFGQMFTGSAETDSGVVVAANEENATEDGENPSEDGEKSKTNPDNALARWVAPIVEKIRAAREKGATLETLKTQIDGWKLDTESLAEAMEQNLINGFTLTTNNKEDAEH